MFIGKYFQNEIFFCCFFFMYKVLPLNNITYEYQLLISYIVNNFFVEYKRNEIYCVRVEYLISLLFSLSKIDYARRTLRMVLLLKIETYLWHIIWLDIK